MLPSLKKLAGVALIAMLFCLLTGLDGNRNALLEGKWELKKAEGIFYNREYRRNDSTWFLNENDSLGYFKRNESSWIFVKQDTARFSTSRNDAGFLIFWMEYFERFLPTMFDLVPELNITTWTFTGEQDSEYVVYDEDGKKVLKTFLSYWKLSGDTLLLSGFQGFYKPPFKFNIDSLTDKDLILGVAGKEYLKLHFQKVSEKVETTYVANIPFKQVSTSITPDNLKITKFGKHPFLVDHERKLITCTADGHLISIDTLYSDTGVGCSSALFDKKDHYLLVDCNGSWYQISKQNGLITRLDWHWEEKPRAKYIGTYFNSRGDDYVLDRNVPFRMEDIYQFKDPHD